MVMNKCSRRVLIQTSSSSSSIRPAEPHTSIRLRFVAAVVLSQAALFTPQLDKDRHWLTGFSRVIVLLCRHTV